LCGLFVPRAAMAPLLEAVSWALPLTYAYDALARAINPAPLSTALLLDVIVVVAAGGGALVLGALTLRRRTA
jgi:ABC-2 type transport system permease protein